MSEPKATYGLDNPIPHQFFPQKPKVYLGGPMTGLQDYNYPAFHAKAKELRDLGFEVFNPAENFGGDQSLEKKTYMRAAISLLMQADAMYLLPGWWNSTGAVLEDQVAAALEMPVFELVEDLLTWTASTKS